MVSLSTYFSTFSKYSLSTGSKLKENIHYTFNDKNLEALPKGKKSVGDIQKYHDLNNSLFTGRHIDNAVSVLLVKVPQVLIFSALWALEKLNNKIR